MLKHVLIRRLQHDTRNSLFLVVCPDDHTVVGVGGGTSSSYGNGFNRVTMFCSFLVANQPLLFYLRKHGRIFRRLKRFRVSLD